MNTLSPLTELKGIGEKTAEKIVSYLGKDTLTTILENPSNLLLIPGITNKQINILNKTLTEYEASYRTIVSLGELGFSTRDSLLIYNKYKEKTTTILNDNIYLIYEDILEITFKKVDTIAIKSGLLPNDIRRIEAAILYVINEVCNLLGHSYLFKEEIMNYVVRILGERITIEEFDSALVELEKDSKIIKINEKYYLTAMYEAVGI